MGPIWYSPRQVGNPVLKEVAGVPLVKGDKAMRADFEPYTRCGVLFLSIRYNNLHPEYIYRRMDGLGKAYELRVLLVHADVEAPQTALAQLTRLCIARKITLIVVWSYQEAGVYLASLNRRSQPNAQSAPLKIQKRRATTLDEQVVEVLTKIPRVNRPDVLNLKKKYGSFAKIVLHADEVGSMNGWGPRKSQAFVRALNESFSGNNPLSSS